MGFQENLPEILKSLDLFVFMSEEEGMPNSVLEAMAAGLPIIATGIPGIRELIDTETRGILVSPGNLDDLVFAANRLLKDAGLSRNLARNAGKWVQENHDQDMMLQKLEKELREAVERESGA